ncbi:MAG: VWA domain-containing protein [Chitinivibrionales bacterium]|nr:VWA domain-containing protein [Chitinivibrionales bacterium]
MRFGSPQYFWLLLLIPAFIGFFIYAHQRRRSALDRFAGPTIAGKLIPAGLTGRQVVAWVLFLCFFFFWAISLARPRFGVAMEMVERRGVDIMVALDVSRSMLAEDVTPSRLKRAKLETGRLIDLLKGDRIGIIIFAGESFVECPLTLDYGAAKMFLENISSDWIDLQGTSLGEAITQAVKSLTAKSKKNKVLIILSDGEDHEGNVLEAARAAAAAGVKVYTVGIGSEQGVPIPVSKAGGNIVYKKDNAGNLVMTRLDPEILEKIAVEGGGKYFQAGTDLDLPRIYGDIARMEKSDFGLNRMTTYEEQYQIFCGIALLIALIALFWPQPKKMPDKISGL